MIKNAPIGYPNTAVVVLLEYACNDLEVDASADQNTNYTNKVNTRYIN